MLLTRKRWIATGGIVIALALLAVFSTRGHGVSHRSAPIEANMRSALTSNETKPRMSLKTHVTSSQASSKNTQFTAAETWTAKFRAANDYLQFVVDALPAALSGDGRAAWFIGEALTSCAFVMKTYRGSADPEAQLNQELTNMPKAPQWGRDALAQKTHRCLSLALKDPFEGLPHVKEGYTSSYWHQQALMDGDPLAQAQAASNLLSEISVTQNMSEGAKVDKLRAAEANLRAAVESGDPDALYNAGMLLSDLRYSNNPLNAIAVALAACDLGHDCSAGNPENPYYNCKLSGACPPDADYAYFMQQSLGPEKYAQAYARALQVKQSVEAGDWDAVLGNLRIDRRL